MNLIDNSHFHFFEVKISEATEYICFYTAKYGEEISSYGILTTMIETF